MANWIEKQDAFAWWVMSYTGVQQCNHCIIAAVKATSMNKHTRLEWGPSRELWWMCVTSTCWILVQPILHCNRMWYKGDHHALQAGQRDNLPIFTKDKPGLCRQIRNSDAISKWQQNDGGLSEESPINGWWSHHQIATQHIGNVHKNCALRIGKNCLNACCHLQWPWGEYCEQYWEMHIRWPRCQIREMVKVVVVRNGIG